MTEAFQGKQIQQRIHVPDVTVLALDEQSGLAADSAFDAFEAGSPSADERHQTATRISAALAELRATIADDRYEATYGN